MLFTASQDEIARTSRRSCEDFISAVMPVRRIGLALLPLLASALDNGLARTPPRGFNPWNVFGHNARGECKLPVPWVCGFTASYEAPAGPGEVEVSLRHEKGWAVRDEGGAAVGGVVEDGVARWSVGVLPPGGGVFYVGK